MRPLPRPRLPTASWLSPVIAAAAWWAVMVAVADQPIATQRSLVFLGGPLFLLAGLHARLFGFLHAPDRVRWLSLPIGPVRHFNAALAALRSRFWPTAALGTLALALAAPAASTASGISVRVGLAVDFAWLVVFAAGIEPFVAGISAELGRRFPPDSRAHELQRSLGGGWTTPEAVVHLYAPALGIGAAVVLAMPGQLSWERFLDTGVLDYGQLGFALAPLSIAVVLRVLASHTYRRGFWDAVAWLSEATRTLAGPPIPEPTPRWATRIPDPWTRLVVVQFWRMTPLPGLRLIVMVGIAVFTLTRAASPTVPTLALFFAAIGLWFVPMAAVGRDRLARARLAAALPLGPRRRAGHLGMLAIVALVTPAVLSGAVVGVRVLVDGVADAHPAPHD